MKTQILYFFLFVSIFSCKGSDKKESILRERNASDTIGVTSTKDFIARDSATTFLNDFYRKYILAVANEPDEVTSLQKNNVTKSFMKKQKEKDFDLLIFAQDMDPEVAKYINVSFIKENKYRVCYLYPYPNGNMARCLAVDLVKEKNKLLIDDVEKVYEKLLGKNSDKESVFEKFVSSIFYRDKKGHLQIDSKKLEYISKNTTREHSEYLIALEEYAEKISEDPEYSFDEISKIKAYIFNTSYPLRKKYWSDKYEQWYGGKPDNILEPCSTWMDKDFYGLPELEENMDELIVTCNCGCSYYG